MPYFLNLLKEAEKHTHKQFSQTVVSNTSNLK